MIEQGSQRDETRSRIVEVAGTMLRERGAAAVTTRAVADGAGVQAPTIYRLFGDKDGLLEAVAEHAMATFSAIKADAVRAARDDATDPVEDLRTGWSMTIGFGLANPDLFVLLSDPERGRRSAAARAGTALLAERIQRVAEAGRLAVPERRAVELVHAAGTGAVLAVLAAPADERDPSLADDVLEAVLGRILVSGESTTDHRSAASDGRGRGNGAVTSAAITLRAAAPRLERLSSAERTMLAEWLDRIAAD
ncbi:TetR/AcrR family transcriptional regulator [Curtobacterium oceanosedimentum]|uniref:TetR/AcrR family transcriptional regulator n=1 Tax=Curtobacterium oceanosedimentum TaxID=465820 RepID=UPI001CE11A90|nr:TetR/AcrR family transcriptional regulator [Curtobacterium oceanosedimentum]MCA5924760.1 TetR/AcrR family transcriptional regulator [Curtobacterium oceanosedimentum]